jgi:1,6-anhydro-N-acetylmuramate kinase
MMPMRPHRKVRTIEKVENFSRTATAWKIVATHDNKSDHACAIRSALDAEFFFIRAMRAAGCRLRAPAASSTRGYAVTPARPRDNSGTIHAAASRLMASRIRL